MAGGPLEVAESSGVVVTAFPAGSTVTYGLQHISNNGTEPLTLTRVVPLIGEPTLEVVDEPQLLGPDRVDVLGAALFDALAGWPVRGVEHHQVDGAVVPPDGSTHFEVVVPVRVPTVEEGIGRVDGFVIDYESDGQRYRVRTSTALVLCPSENPQACEEFEPE